MTAPKTIQRKSNMIVGTPRTPCRLFQMSSSSNSTLIAIAACDNDAITDLSVQRSSSMQEVAGNNLELRFFRINTSAGGNTKAVAEVYLYPPVGTTGYAGTGVCYGRMEFTFTSNLFDSHPITGVTTTDWAVADGVDFTTSPNFCLWPPSLFSNTIGRESPVSIDMRGYSYFDVRIVDVNSTDDNVGGGVVVGWREW